MPKTVNLSPKIYLSPRPIALSPNRVWKTCWCTRWVSHHSHVCRKIQLWPYCEGVWPRPTEKRNTSTGEDQCHTDGPNPTACRTVCRSPNILERWEQIWTVPYHAVFNRCSSYYVFLLFSFLHWSLLCCATACQSRPRRPGNKHTAFGDKQDVTDTGDPWNQWEKTAWTCRNFSESNLSCILMSPQTWN